MWRGFSSAAGVMLALWLAPVAPARALDFSIHGYGDIRLVGAPSQTSWVKGGLSKFRYGGPNAFRFAEAVAEARLSLDDNFSLVGVLRAEPEDRDVVDPLEAYLLWHDAAGETGLSWSVKAGAFFPTISLENDDLGWTSPYTLTPSAINSWIGEELRTMGGEATLRWKTRSAGTFSVLGSINCCNDPAGILMADRGWAMDDRPTGLLERVRMPDASLRLFHAPVPGTTGEFLEIDKRLGWYGGLGWQMGDIGKLTVLRYDNQGDPADRSPRDTAWETKFWSFGARTQIAGVVLIGQQLTGYTSVVVRGAESATKFQSTFLLASYDVDDDWRVSLRGDVFQTRHLTATPPHIMSEDGHAVTAAVIWSGYDWLRLTGEVLVMDSRRLEYLNAGLPSADLAQSQVQFSARFFF